MLLKIHRGQNNRADLRKTCSFVIKNERSTAATEPASALLLAPYLHTLLVMSRLSSGCLFIVKTLFGKQRLSTPALTSRVSNRLQLFLISLTISHFLPLSTSHQSLFSATAAACCSQPTKSSSPSPTAALIQQQWCRTSVCTENRACPLPSHALADCIHLSN